MQSLRAFLALLLLSSPVHAAVRSYTLRTPDGVMLAASFYEPSRRPAPGIILVHMLTRTREDWHPLASRLSDAGFAVLTFDLRGHGGSSGTALTDRTAPLAPMLTDVAAARAFLQGRPEVVASRLGIGGASIGANLAALAAADDPAVRSIALLSPGLDYRGLRIEAAFKKYGDRPALLVAGGNDPYAVRSVRQLAAIGGGIRDLRTYASGGHGTVILARAPDLVGTLVDWFARTL